MLTRVATLTALACVLAVGCTGDPEPNEFECEGACDVYGGGGFMINYEAVNEMWPGEPVVDSPEDLYTVNVVLGEQTIPVPSHIFGDINIIPYHNDDGAMDSSFEPENTMERGDSIVAQYFQPGDIGIGVMHHRSEYRTLDVSNADPSAMKEDLKFQDTHIEIIVGVADRDGAPGVVTLNNPETYQSGRFGDSDYMPMVFAPIYPEYLTPEQEGLFRDNIRTMAIGFNAATEFPSDYNGGDPLGANSPARVVEHVTNMVNAIAGDADALAYFNDPLNLVYCAELAHLSYSAGLIVPLNAATMVPLVGEENWNTFVHYIDSHNAGESTPFTDLNDNRFASMVELTVAPEELMAASAYSSDAADAARLAFNPWTMADMVEQFIRGHIPREQLGEQLAPAQGAILEAMRPGLIEQMNLHTLPYEAADKCQDGIDNDGIGGADNCQDNHPQRAAVEMLYDEIVRVVSTPHADYAAFRTAIEPHLATARQMTGPRGDDGVGLFVPPHSMHMVAMGRNPGGMVGLRYVGHMLNIELMTMVE